MNEIWASDELLELTRQGVEVWRVIANTKELYEVSNLGRVRSWNWSGNERAPSPAILNCNPNTDGYAMIQIGRRAGRRLLLAHVAMLEAFVCPRPEKMEGGHKDDNKQNMTLLNVRWCTKAANEADRVRNGKTMAFRRECRIIDGVEHFRCTGKCGEWKRRTEFGTLSAKNRSHCGIHSCCKICLRIRQAELKRAARRRAKAA